MQTGTLPIPDFPPGRIVSPSIGLLLKSFRRHRQTIIRIQKRQFPFARCPDWSRSPVPCRGYKFTVDLGVSDARLKDPCRSLLGDGRILVREKISALNVFRRPYSRGGLCRPAARPGEPARRPRANNATAFVRSPRDFPSLQSPCLTPSGGSARPRLWYQWFLVVGDSCRGLPQKRKLPGQLGSRWLSRTVFQLDSLYFIQIPASRLAQFFFFPKESICDRRILISFEAFDVKPQPAHPGLP
jgi:hypothetical protein